MRSELLALKAIAAAKVDETTDLAQRVALLQAIAMAELGKHGQNPLDGRPGLRTEPPKRNALARDLGQLASRHHLMGVVLISFTGDERVGVNSSGEPDLFASAMEQLGDRILAAIDDGQFEPGVEGDAR